MKTRSFLFALLIVFTALLIASMTGCKKDSEGGDTSVQSATDNSLAENLYADVFKVVDDAAKGQDGDLYGQGKSKSLLDGGCATLTIYPFDTITWPKTLTIDFGSENCLGNDGKYRRGVIIVKLTGRYLWPNTTITITTDEYFVNDHKIEGVKTVINNGRNEDDFLEFLISVENGKITRPDGKQFLWESNRKRIWIEGEETPWPEIFDDVYLISGAANGTNINELDFEIEITNDLRVEIGCKWIVSGTLELRPEGLYTRILDYGDGACDNQATVTVNGITFNITLP